MALPYPQEEDRQVFLEAILDAAQDAMVVIDDDMVISWNRFAESIFGYSKEEAPEVGKGAIFHFKLPTGRGEEDDRFDQKPFSQ